MFCCRIAQFNDKDQFAETLIKNKFPNKKVLHVDTQNNMLSGILVLKPNDRRFSISFYFS